ncbi:MAG TPA: transglycosylase SLT domain-containing protein [Polyangiaceae bacterium]|nr:transglycosylase SLT domain-containing protein [Polyangiaceae bacterium]
MTEPKGNEPVAGEASLREFFGSEPSADGALSVSEPPVSELPTSDPPKSRPSLLALLDEALNELDPDAAAEATELEALVSEPPLAAGELAPSEPPPSEPPSVIVIPVAALAADESASPAPHTVEPSDAPMSSPGLVALSQPPASGRTTQSLAPAPRDSSRPRRRRRTWLFFAAAGAVALGMCGGEDPSDAPAAHDDSLDARRSASTAPFTFDVDGPFTAATLGSATALLGAKSGDLANASPVLLDRNARKPAATSSLAKPETDPNIAKALEAFELTARPVVPGRTWQESANASDWPSVALSIDALPAAEQAESGARYARAVAARELGQCDVALRVLEGLDAELPLLGTEIAELRARCQLEVGPFDAAYRYFSEDQTPENLTLAARAAAKGGDIAKAEQTIEKALSKLRKQDGRRAQKKELAARLVRAGLLETKGQPKAAARDWLWLATEAPLEPESATADDTYERLSGSKLGSVARLERMRTFAREGEVERTLREYARLTDAPGPTPDRVDIASALAWAYYHSRSDYPKAGELFREAAQLSADSRVKFLFFEARALSRANEDDRALAAYRELVRRYPGGPYTEQAYYRIARIEYGRGRWQASERAYVDYLDRYGRNGGGQYASASRYELAISRIGAKERTDEAAQTLGQLAKKERRASRRVALTELEAVALELTHEPAKVEEAVSRYRTLVEEHPLSFAARASAARLRALGSVEPRSGAGQLPAFDPSQFDGARLPEKAQFLADIGLHTDAERALFDARRAAHEKRGPGDAGQTLCGMYGALDRGFRSYALAERLLKRDDLGRLPSADNLWAWRCKYPEPYRDIVNAVEARYHLPPSLVHAVMRQESGFRPAVVSPVGAIGLMQLMPNTAMRAAEEIMQQPGAPWVPDPKQPTNVLNNLELGGFYLSKLLNQLGGQLPVVVAAYNAGPQVVSSWLAGGEDLPIDVWVGRIPFTETRDYVSIVLGNWLAYRFLDNPTELPELKLALVPGIRAAPDAY